MRCRCLRGEYSYPSVLRVDFVYQTNNIYLNNNLLPPTFDNFFIPVYNVHSQNTRLASKLTYILPKARTNFGIFNIRYQGAKIWNSLHESYLYDLYLLIISYLFNHIHIYLFINHIYMIYIFKSLDLPISQIKYKLRIDFLYIIGSQDSFLDLLKFI